jgi:D-glycero-alpha-D-manno-heptose-7-phosphate kinase
MILTRTPYRVTLGGGTDLPSFYREYGGFILAVAIDKYMFLNVNTPIVDDKIRVRYTASEIVDHVDDVKHTLAREALRLFGITNGIEIVSIADIPAGTGLGSSSSYLVGLLNALHALFQDQATPQKLAEEACQIELEVLKKPIGKQDQYMAAFGGLTTLDINPDGRVCDALGVRRGSGRSVGAQYFDVLYARNARCHGHFEKTERCDMGEGPQRGQ